jgi:putative ABC transport system permease protein
LIKLSPQTTAAHITTQLPSFVDRHLVLDSMLHLLHFAIVLQPLSDIHFNTAYAHDGTRKANLPVLYGLMGAAGFILLLAIVNFINLSTAQALRRSRETGIRRILGSSRWQLTVQFLTETALITLLAATLSILLVYPILRLFHTWLPEELHPFDGPALLFLLCLTAVTTLLAGIYPARLLSTNVLSTRRYTVRKALIVFQFTISLVFIIGSLVFSKQLHYMLNTDPGFARSAIITSIDYNASSARLDLLARRTRQIPGIRDLTIEGHAPASDAIIEIPVRFENAKDKDELVSLQAADDNFIPFYHIPLLAGRNLVKDDSAREVIINNTYRQHLGFKKPADALGHVLSWTGQSYSIVGVIADFHAGSFRDPVYPLLIAPLPNLRHSIAFRLTAGANTAATLKQLADAWQTIFPGDPFDYHFLDASIARLYENEIRFSWLVHAVTILAIAISCMGLLGLILFIAERKKKEISIRKVLGAGIADIIWLLNKEFAGLIGIALLIATPIAGYGVHRWLENYAYQTTVSWWVFVLAGFAALAITALTISYRVIRAARANPVDNLRI